VWLEERLEYLARCFSAEVAGYAVMSNHVHVIVRMNAAMTHTWSAVEVVRRWQWRCVSKNAMNYRVYLQFST
jgi:hypothetical protein